MSNISFPHTQGNGHHEDQFYQPSFDTSSFQMNPLSPHPPRTPKTSLHASSLQHFGSASIYEDASEVVEEKISFDVEDVEIEEGNDDVKDAETKVREEEIWRDIIVSSNGRDKLFKLIQYSIRLGLWFHLSLTSSKLLRRPSRPLWEQEIVKRLTSTTAGLSLTRKLLLLFNWLNPLTQITAQQSVPFSTELLTEKQKKVGKPFLHTLLYAPPPVLLELVSAIADDLSTWSKLGLFGKKFGDRVGRLADWCWFLSTIVGLVENGVERQINEGLQSQVQSRLYKESISGATAKSRPKSSKLDDTELARLRKQDYWLQVTRAKLVMDLIFVSYEIFEFNRAKDFIKAATGLASAILSSTKLYDRHKNALLKTILASS